MVAELLRYKTDDLRKDVALEVALYVSHPMRKPHMLERMGSVFDELKSSQDLRTVLDCGGGKDSILYARCGYDVTYCDLLSHLTPIRGRAVSKERARD